MLRDLPPFQSQPHGEVFMNTAGTEDEPRETSADYVDPFDDVFGSAPSSPAPNAHDDHDDTANNESTTSGTLTRLSDHPSDVSRLRSVHVTNGYREGIAASKEKCIQEGFDEGYSLGAEIALKAGYILGALEGLLHAIASASIDSPASDDNGDEARKGVHVMLEEAEKEMQVEHILGKEYFGEDGVWIYDVSGEENEAEVTFAKVAEAHPMIKHWTARLDGLCEQLGLALE